MPQCRRCCRREHLNNHLNEYLNENLNEFGSGLRCCVMLVRPRSSSSNPFFRIMNGSADINRRTGVVRLASSIRLACVRRNHNRQLAGVQCYSRDRQLPALPIYCLPPPPFSFIFSEKGRMASSAVDMKQQTAGRKRPPFSCSREEEPEEPERKKPKVLFWLRAISVI